jgi:hypothetical protein
LAGGRGYQVPGVLCLLYVLGVNALKSLHAAASGSTAGPRAGQAS